MDMKNDTVEEHGVAWKDGPCKRQVSKKFGGIQFYKYAHKI